MHLSDIRNYERCIRLLWLEYHQPKQNFPMVYYNENMMSLVKEYFHLSNYYEGNTGDDPQKAVTAMKQFDTLINARFSHCDLRVHIPLMRKAENGWNIYFTYASCFPREQQAQKLADKIAVVKACGVVVSDVQIIHLNENYVRKQKLDIQELLIVTPYLYNKRNNGFHTAMELITKHERDVFQIAEKAFHVLKRKCAKAHLSPSCTKSYKCPYYDDCFTEQEHDTSVLYIMQCAKKFTLLEHGINDMREVDFEVLEGTRLQFAQIMAAKANGFYMDRFALSSWVNQNIFYPLSYLDFEWETFVYPPYDGMKPYDVLVFQYSLHIETSENAPLIHEEFIGEKDCRIEFIEHLLKHIPKRGTVLVYNMEGAEKLRLTQLGEQFPQYQEELTAICERMVDLSLPFSSGSIYDSKMHGYYSLKKIVEVFCHFDYHSLAISQGLQAAESWRMMQEDHADKERIRKELFEYCGMDTYSEYLIFHKICELIQQKQEAIQQTNQLYSKG